MVSNIYRLVFQVGPLSIPDFIDINKINKSECGNTMCGGGVKLHLHRSVQKCPILGNETVCLALDDYSQVIVLTKHSRNFLKNSISFVDTRILSVKLKPYFNWFIFESKDAHRPLGPIIAQFHAEFRKHLAKQVCIIVGCIPPTCSIHFCWGGGEICLVPQCISTLRRHTNFRRQITPESRPPPPCTDRHTSYAGGNNRLAPHP